MAVFTRDDTGDTINLPTLSVQRRYPAALTEFPVESGAPVSDHRQELLREYVARGVVTTETGLTAPVEAERWFAAAASTTISVQPERNRDTLVGYFLGSWSVAERSGDAIEFEIPLKERHTVSVQSPNRAAPRRRPAPRADQAVGNASSREDGSQPKGGDENRSLLAQLFDLGET